MVMFLQNIVNGLIVGGTYAMMGIGLTLIFGVMKVVNFAHGEFYMLGAFLFYSFIVLLKWSYLVSVIGSLVSVTVIAFLIERFTLKQLRDKPMDNNMIFMIGLSILLQNLALIIWGGTPKNIKLPFPVQAISIGPIVVTPIRAFIVFIAITVILVCGYFLAKTKFGKAIRATFQDEHMASALGININIVYSFIFMLGCFMASLAGILLSPIYVVLPTMGNLVTAKAFAVAIAGGLGNFPGAIIAGFLLGVTESLGAAYISSGYKDAIGFILIVLVLILKPKWITKAI